MENRTYYVGDQGYSIPFEEIDSFIEMYPEAEESVLMDMEDGTQYDLPMSKLEEFKVLHPGAILNEAQFDAYPSDGALDTINTVQETPFVSPDIKTQVDAIVGRDVGVSDSAIGDLYEGATGDLLSQSANINATVSQSLGNSDAEIVEQTFNMYYREAEKMFRGKVKVEEQNFIKSGMHVPASYYTEEDIFNWAKSKSYEDLEPKGIAPYQWGSLSGMDYLKDQFSSWDKAAEVLPFVGGASSIYHGGELMMAYQALSKWEQEGQPVDDKTGIPMGVTKEQVDLVEKSSEMANIDKDWTYWFASIATQLPALAIEIGSTAGVYTATKETVKQSTEAALTKMVSYFAKKTGKDVLDNAAVKFGLQFTSKTAGVAAGTVSRMASKRGVAVTGLRTGASISSEMTQDEARKYQAIVSGDGVDETIRESEAISDDILSGILYAYSDLFGEMSGGGLHFASREAKDFAIKKGWLNSFFAKNPSAIVHTKAISRNFSDKLNKTFKTIGYHNPVAEMFEERFTDAMKATLADVGIGHAEFEWPDKAQWVGEATALSLLGVGKGAVELGESLIGPSGDITTAFGVPVVKLETEMVDGEGNPVIARYDTESGNIEINQPLFDELAPEKQDEILSHEEAHAMYEELSEDQKNEVEKVWDTLSDEERAIYEERFPTDLGGHTEMFAEDYVEWFKNPAGPAERSAPMIVEAIYNKKEKLRQEVHGIVELVDLFKELDVEDSQIFEITAEAMSLKAKILSGEMTSDQAMKALQDHGIEIKEDEDLSDFIIKGENEQISADGFVLTDVIKIFRGSDIGTVIEERSEAWYKRQELKDKNFQSFIKEERARFEERSGEKTTEKDIEWFSSLAKRYATGVDIQTPIGKKLKDILEKFKQYAKALFKDGETFKKLYDEGKVSSPLQGALESALTEEVEAEPVPTKEEGEKTQELERQKAGLYTGSPQIKSPQALGALANMLENLALEGEAGRFWYEDSSQKILDIVGNDLEEAEILAAFVAALSPQTGIQLNMNFAIEAYSQWKAGAEFDTGRFPNSMRKDLKAIVRGERPETIKRNNFYINLMRVIDPSMKQGVTVDLWMARLFGYKGDAPTSTQYKFMEEFTKKISDRLGWEPQQTQAALWVAMKSRWDVAKNIEMSKAKKKGDFYQSENGKWRWKSREVELKWRDKTRKSALKLKDISTDVGVFNFADAIKNSVQQISTETEPGVESGILPGIANAAWEEKAEYDVVIRRILSNENGRDKIAEVLGLLEVDFLDAPGAWQETVQPGRQIYVAGSGKQEQKHEGIKTPERYIIDPAIIRLMDEYSALYGLLTYQDGVGWTKLFTPKTLKDADATLVNIGRALSKEETRELYDEMRSLTGSNDFTPIAHPDGALIINFADNQFFNDNGSFNEKYREPFSGISNNDILAMVEESANKALKDVPEELTLVRFASNGKLIERGDNGKGYKSTLSNSSRSGEIKQLYNDAAPRIDQTNKDFSEKFDWGNAGRKRKSLTKTFEIEKAPDPTPEQLSYFKNLFSGVKNLDGTPKVLYHGTIDPSFDTFARGDIGFHFGSHAQANNRLKDLEKVGRWVEWDAPVVGEEDYKAGSWIGRERGDYTKRYNPQILPVYLALRNPLRVPDLGDWNELQILNAMYKAGIIDLDTFHKLTPDAGPTASYDTIRSMLKRAGHDGIVYRNTIEGTNKYNHITTRGVKLTPEQAEKYHAVWSISYKGRQIPGMIADVKRHAADTDMESPGYEILNTDFSVVKELDEELPTPHLLQDAIDDALTTFVPGLVKDIKQQEDSFIVFDPYQIKSVYNESPETTGLDFEIKRKGIEQAKLDREKKALVIEIRSRDATDKAALVPEFIRNRRSFIDTKTLETNIFVDELNKVTSPLERELIPFLIEGTPVTEALNRPDLMSLQSDLGVVKRLEPVVKRIRQRFDQVWEAIVEANPDMEGRAMDDYVTHIWDIPKNKRQMVGDWMATHNKFLNKRYINTLMEGVEEFGLKPKVLDIGEIMQFHNNLAYRVIANKKFVEQIKGLSQDGYKLISSRDNSPENWVEIQNQALRDPYTGAYYKVHPDLAPSLKVILDSRIDMPLTNAYQIIGGLLKKLNLSISFFHHLALTETGIATMGAAKTLRITNPISFIYNGFIKGDNLAFKKAPIALDAVEHNLQLGASTDIPVQQIKGMLRTLQVRSAGIIGLNKATKLLETFNQKWDTALWDWLHDGLKLLAYEQFVSKIDPNSTEDITTKKREIAQFVNDTFGGQNWDILMVSPKTRQVLGWMLLSPDWTLSTIRQALSVTGLGAVNKDNRIDRMKMGAMFWGKALIYFGTLINGLNVMYRKRDEEEFPELYPDDMNFWDYTMFGNTIGKQTNLFTGRDSDGRENYIRWGKQFRELPELFYDDSGFNFPQAMVKKLGSKANPLLQTIVQVFTGKTLSGFENYNLKEKKGLDWTIGLMKTLGEAPLPFSSKSFLREDKDFKPADLFLPSSTGMTRKRAKELYSTAIKRGDFNMMRQVYMGAYRNNMDAYTLFDESMRSVTSELSFDLMKDLKTIEDINAQLLVEDSPGRLKALANRLKRMHKEEEYKSNALNLLEAATSKMETYYELHPGDFNNHMDE